MPAEYYDMKIPARTAVLSMLNIQSGPKN